MLETSIALLIFLLPLAYSPGPGNLFFAANGARFGVRATLPANLGYHIATWGVTFAIGFGFIAAMVEFPVVFRALKIGGAIYVLWLAWQLFRAGVMGDRGKARVAGFWDGALLLLLNPKAYAIIALMFTQFLSRDDNKLADIALITTVFTFNNLIAFLVWTAMGDRLAVLFRSAATARGLNIGFAAMLALVAVWMFFG